MLEFKYNYFGMVIEREIWVHVFVTDLKKSTKRQRGEDGDNVKAISLVTKDNEINDTGNK